MKNRQLGFSPSSGGEHITQGVDDFSPCVNFMLSLPNLPALLDLPPGAPLVAESLKLVGFKHLREAHAQLLRIADEGTNRVLFGDTLQVLLILLSEHAQPDHALVNFERLTQTVSSRADLFLYFRENPRAVEILVRLFVGSQFLTEIVLRNPGYIERLTQHQRLSEIKSVQQLSQEAEASMQGCATLEERHDALRRFQQWELLRIGTCDFFGLLDLRRVTVQLSLLADALVQSCLNVAREDSGAPEGGFSILAMGKLGGEELNYSSDIDLVFLAEDNGPLYWRLAQRLIKGLTTATGNGFLYRVDMRLRPWGASGELVSPRESYLAYLQSNAQSWEKQALLKARVIAGDRKLGRAFLKETEGLVFNEPADVLRESVRGMKLKIEAGLQKKGRQWGEVKLGEGSIRDVEFVCQYLQLRHGGQVPEVRSFNTLDALVRLTDMGMLHADEYRLLTDGYCFLRSVEHSLQLMHNKQTHALPQEPEELTYLARRLDFSGGAEFLAHYRQHCTAIRMVFDRYLGSRDKAKESRAQDLAKVAKPAFPENSAGAGRNSPGVTRHLARLERSYAETFSEPDIEIHAGLAERISDEEQIIVEVLPLSLPDGTASGDWRVTIVGFDFPGELSHICGLMLVHGLNILDGQVFTYEPASTEPANPAMPPKAGSNSEQRRRSTRRPGRGAGPVSPPATSPDLRQKIVDVFTVRPERGAATPELWKQYTEDLRKLVRQLASGHAKEAQGSLVKRVAAALRQSSDAPTGTLYPVQIQIDNLASEHYTVLQIETRDTIGFLYELSNALTLNGVNVSRVSVQSAGSHIRDTLYVTDEQGRKITDANRQWELQAALVLIKHFTHLLPHSPNPETALLHFREFLAQLFLQPEWADEIATLERSDVLDALARLLGVSDFLWNDFLRMQHANLFPVVRDIDKLATTRSKADLVEELAALLKAADSPSGRREELNAFKDREMFRVDMRHILGHSLSFSDFSQELTDIAEVVVAAAVLMVDAELRELHGEPRLGASESDCPLAVCALGKCGGRELGFASDIELMFVYAGDGTTTGATVTGRTVGPQPLGRHLLSTGEYYVKLVEAVSHAIRARREGIFEIDLRLRPYGRAGSAAVSLEAFKEYFAPDGPAWPFERQALVKLRPIAGDADLGRKVSNLRDAFLYTGKPFDVAAMRAMRERQIRQLVTPGRFNAKLSAGGLVDIEYLVQGLQISHGHAHPHLRHPNTLQAMSALVVSKHLSAADFNSLAAAYLFMRKLIGALRIVRGNARDLTVPTPESEEFSFLAARLGYEDASARLAAENQEHAASVLEISERLLG